MNCPLRGPQGSPLRHSHVRQNVGGGQTTRDGGSRLVCPLSPTFDATFDEDSTVGERAGVRGICKTDILVRRAIDRRGCPSYEALGWPPHPSPLPRNTPR